MLDLSKPIRTRDGRAVTIIAADVRADIPGVEADTIRLHNEPIFAEIEGDGRHFFFAGGNMYTARESARDLVNVPEAETRFYALGDTEGGFRFGKIGAPCHDSRSLARNAAGWGPKVLKITFENSVPVSAELV